MTALIAFDQGINGRRKINVTSDEEFQLEAICEGLAEYLVQRAKLEGHDETWLKGEVMTTMFMVHGAALKFFKG